MRRIGAVRAALFTVLGLAMASVASANHDTDCTASGGTNGPTQLDCRLPDFVAAAGSQQILTSSFVYTASTDQNPVTCAVGTLSVVPVGGFLSLDTTVLDATAPPYSQEVQVIVDPSGLGPGTYEGEVRISLTPGAAPMCPSGERTGTVFVRLVITPSATAPALAPIGLMVLATGLGLAGLLRLRSARRRH